MSDATDDGNTTPPEGRTTSQLQTPTGYTGLYAVWDEQDVDGDGVSGDSAEPPRMSYRVRLASRPRPP